MKTIKKHWMLLLMLLPAVIYVLIFSYIPMTGIVLAFKKYNYAGGIYGSPWNGLANFKALAISGKLGLVTRNTLLYNIAFIALGVVFEMGSAILLNELRNKYFKKMSQSLMFLPYFISWVVAGAIMYNIFNYERGVFNHVLNLFGAAPFDLYNSPKTWPYILVFLKLWKQTGYGSVVYLAAITGLDQEMFEAASIDGANAWQKIRYLTIPSLRATMMTLVLLAIGNIFRGDFGLFYQTVKSNAILEPMTDVIDTYVFRLLIDTGNIGVSAAAGLFQSVLCFVTITVCNKLVKMVNPDYALY
ncbi:MAG: sugar ABC transporter permease [Lachnospiraceae bacterium]|jgi:putative aldouronate transport system permease protein|nr:sugar ABC transporter permease [Lachnospiraceae bacterium]MBP5599348.1 sugar ABC transporter permease [Lachnospiraceae bacterium]MBR5356154.1 sugar ABC transporter permease [Lachnospiraceae bacterium]